MSQPKISGVTIRFRLSALTCGLLLAAIALFATATFVEVRRSSIAAASTRVKSVTGQLAAQSTLNQAQLRTQLRLLAERPIIRAYLSHPTVDPFDSTWVALESLRDAEGRVAAAELWSADGARTNVSWSTLKVPPPLAPRALIALLGDQPVTTSPMVLAGDSVAFAIIARVGREKSPAGYLVTWRRVASAQSRVAGIIGPDARLLIGNARGDVWTDLERVLPAPSMDFTGADTAVRIIQDQGRAQLAAAAVIPGTPWAVIVELPRSFAMAESVEFLRALTLVGVFVLLIGAIGVWMISGIFTTPLASLAEAAAALSEGDYSRRVDVARHDEIGVLAGAFNTMTESIAAGGRALHEKVRELATSDERYRLLFHSNPHPMWVFDLASLRFLAVNDAAVQKYGFSREEFLAMSLHEIRPAEDATRLMHSQVLQPVDLYEPEMGQHRTKDGRFLWVELSARSLTFDGRAARLVLAHDVTERRKAERELHATQLRLQHVIASSSAVIYSARISTGKPALDWISENVTRILGYSAEETCVPGWWESHMHPDDLPEVVDESGRIAMQDAIREYRLRDRDGQYRWIRDELRVLRDASGNATEVVGAWLDITDQRMLEDQFRQAQKLEAVGRLAGGLAHDFNNLLTVILGECDLALASMTERDPLVAPLEEIRKAGQRASHLTSQLLMFSRRQLVEPKVVSFNDLAGDMNSMLRRLIGEDIDLTTRLSADAGLVRADRGQMEQVLVNLVINARDAMPQGGSLLVETRNVRLDHEYARTHAGVTPGDYVMLAVSDTGMGMSTTVQAHLFEPFFTTKAPGKGTGLGLATCYAIVRRFDGHIGVYSEPGKGTVIKVYIPAVHNMDAETSLSTTADAKMGRETILLVEDEAQVRAVAARMLRARGFVVLEAGDGEAALQLLEGHPGHVDLLLTDVVLPKMGGRVLAEHVVAMRPDIRVLFASGYTEDVILHHRLLQRGIALLHKPFSSDSLVSKVRETLDRPAESDEGDDAEVASSPYLDHATPVAPTSDSRPRPAINLAADRSPPGNGSGRLDASTQQLPS